VVAERHRESAGRGGTTHREGVMVRSGAFGGAAGPPGFAGAAGSPGFFAGTGSTEGGFGFPCESFGSPLGGGAGAFVSSAMCGACQRFSAGTWEER